MDILQFLSAAGAVVPASRYGTPDWSIWNQNAAGVLTNDDEINQSIITICSTVIGSDPLRPEFGCNFLPCLDLPINLATPKLIARLRNAVATWEPRVNVVSIDVSATVQGRLSVVINWERAASNGAPQAAIFTLQ